MAGWAGRRLRCAFLRLALSSGTSSAPPQNGVSLTVLTNPDLVGLGPRLLCLALSVVLSLHDRCPSPSKVIDVLHRPVEPKIV